MLYMHYCKRCHFIHMLNGHKVFCPRCSSRLVELEIPYTEYVHLNKCERKILLNKCSNADTLTSISTSYNMMKYCKWFRTYQQCAVFSNPYISDTGTISVSNVS